MNFEVIISNFVYFMVGRFPQGPLGGVALTLWLSSASIVFSFIGGLVLCFLSLSKRYWLAGPVQIFIHTLRGIPLLMVIFWMYFLIPVLFGKGVPENITVIVALSTFTSAYMSQIVRAGIESIPKGQWEAGLSAGLTHHQIMRYIILPPALRNMIPSFVNQFVSLIKDTSLAFIVGVNELIQVANQVNNRTLNFPAEIFFFVALVYFVICFSLTSLARRLERRLAHFGKV